MVEFLQFLLMLAVPAFLCSVATWLWRKPIASLPAGFAMDLRRSRHQLMLENALLRQQLIVLRRQVNRPQLNNTDRALLVLLAGRLSTWKSALFIVKPDTLLRWHRAGFRLFWRRKSKAGSRQPKLPTQTIELIRQMAAENRLWGAERVRGELLKLNIRVCKRTIQKYMRQVRRPGPAGRKPNQTWCTFVRNHTHQLWACDVLPVYDLFFRPLFIFFIVELGSRRVVHFNVTRCPTDKWTAQMERSAVLRQATPFGQAPRFLIRDNDSKYGEKFSRVAESSGIEMLRTPYKAPRANAFCERFVGSVRRECVDHLLILGERHLHSVIREYVQYYNCARPHQGIDQRIPEAVRSPVQEAPPTADGADRAETRMINFPVLGGLHHDYRRVA